MSAAKIDELNSDITELHKLRDQAKRKRVYDFLTLELRKFETELKLAKESAENETPMTVTLAPSSSQRRYEIKLNGYGWDQSDKYIQIFVTLKDVQKLSKEQVFCKLTERSMELHVENLDNKDYILIIKNLLEPINVDKCYWKQKTDMVVIYLAKMKEVKWSHVTELEKRFDDKRSSKLKPNDMDNKDPQESIMNIMKNMYEHGDDDMKRTIAKAWYEGQNKQKTDVFDL